MTKAPWRTVRNSTLYLTKGKHLGIKLTGNAVGFAMLTAGGKARYLETGREDYAGRDPAEVAIEKWRAGGKLPVELYKYENQRALEAHGHKGLTVDGHAWMVDTVAAALRQAGATVTILTVPDVDAAEIRRSST